MRLAIVTFGILAVTACTKTAVPVDIANACAADNEKKYLSVAGYLDDRGSIFCSNIGGGPVRCGLDVIAQAGGPKVFSADIEQGSGSSSIEKMESGYKKSDIKIRDAAGNIIKLTDKLRFTGEMNVAPNVCYMKVDRIEAAQ